MEEKDFELYRYIFTKDALKQKVYDNVKEAFDMLRNECRTVFDTLVKLKESDYASSPIQLGFTEKSETEFSISFSSDVLLFSLHSNVFEFSRSHPLMQNPYINEDRERSYCGVIHIYNFLADSLQYGRDNDLGYMIGRLFINKENHYFVEGKQELGVFYTNFGHAVFDQEASSLLLRNAMDYCARFDLLTPPYDEIKDVTVGDLLDELAHKKMTTGKRLGFRFSADRAE
ncbi:MAG: hypothetical protein NC396_07565 [Bacteroides sp.]|nr:hypothetical protein [Bacteroides sp.]MCM1086188.1 hypothetical protein [Bacteroides sp.]